MADAARPGSRRSRLALSLGSEPRTGEDGQAAAGATLACYLLPLGQKVGHQNAGQDRKGQDQQEDVDQ